MFKGGDLGWRGGGVVMVVVVVFALRRGGSTHTHSRGRAGFGGVLNRAKIS
jgi:hypothetical protein